MPARRTAPLPATATITGLFGLGLLANSAGVSLAQSPPGASQPASPLTGYITQVSGTSVRLSLNEGDGIQPGDEFSVIQYNEEIARLRVKQVSKKDAIADLMLWKRGSVVRRLDTVVPLTAVPHPASDLEAPPAAMARGDLKPQRERRSRSRRRGDDTEVVSRGDWTYPALSTLAQHQLLPNVPDREFHGDQQLTRGEIRDLVNRALESDAARSAPAVRSGALPSSGTIASSPAPPSPVAVRASTGEDTPKTDSDAPIPTPSAPAPPLAPSAPEDSSTPSETPPVPDLPPPASRSQATDRRLLYHLAKEYDVPTDLPEPKRGLALSHFSRYRLATGDEPSYLSSGAYQGFMSLGKDRYAVVSVSKARREWYGDHGSKGTPWVEEAFVKSKWLGVDWNIGKRNLRWGPGYSGSLTLGDAAPAVPMIWGSRGWSLGRRLGYWKAEQFVSRFKETGGNKYWMGRRLSHPFSQQWSLNVMETAKSSRALNPLGLVLPFLLYQRIFEKDTNVINIQEGINLSYQTGANEAYAELFIDDITAPKGLGQGRVPRKIGYLFGWRKPHLFGQEGTDLRVEYARTDPNTYLHRNPDISYFNRGLPLGHPMGPNAQLVMVRADRRVSSRMELTGTVQFLAQSKTPPPDSAKGTALMLAAAYDLRKNRSLTVQLSPGRGVDRYNPQGSGSVAFIADWSF